MSEDSENWGSVYYFVVIIAAQLILKDTIRSIPEVRPCPTCQKDMSVFRTGAGKMTTEIHTAGVKGLLINLFVSCGEM